MNDKFKTRIQDKNVRKDSVLMGDFAQSYCAGNHSDRPRKELASDGAELGLYGKRIPVVCDECADLLRYCERRRAFCPKDPKPFCSHCDTHCYAPKEAEQVREVMRYAGPRSLGTRHTVASIKHVIEGRKHKKKDQSGAK